MLRKFELSHLLDEAVSFLFVIVNRPDENEQSALLSAIKRNNKSLVEVLFKYGAISSSTCVPRLHHRLSSSKLLQLLPVHAAARIGNVKMFITLARHNAITLKADASRMNNLFHVAAYFNRAPFLLKVKKGIFKNYSYFNFKIKKFFQRP